MPRAWMPGPDRKSGPVRINYVVRIFWSGFCWSGPWSGFFGPDFFGPVRGPDYLVRIIWSGFSWSGPWSGFSGPDFHWSGPWSGFFGPDNPYRSGFFCGPVCGPVFFKIKKSGPDHLRYKNFGPVRILVWIFKIKKSGPDHFRFKNFSPVRMLVRIFKIKKSGLNQFSSKTSVRSGYWFGFSQINFFSEVVDFFLVLDIFLG